MHSALIRVAALLVVVACIVTTVGCGYIASGVAGAFAARDGGGGGTVTVDGNDASTAQVVSFPQRGESIQTVRILVADAEGDPATAALEYMDDGAGAVSSPVTSGGATDGGGATIGGSATSGGGATSAAASALRPATIVAIRRVLPGDDEVVPLGGAAPGRTPPLETTQAGVQYDLDWAWRDDLGGAARRGATVRLSLEGSSAPPVLVEGVKVGNDRPVLTGVSVEGREGRVVVKYDLLDSTGDACDVTAIVSAPGSAPATLETGGPRPDIVGGRTRGLVVSPTAQRIDFTWDTAVRFGGRDVAVSVRLLAEDDAGASSDAVDATGIALDNNRPPLAVVSTPSRSTSGLVTVPYLLIDAEGDLVDVAVLARREGAPASSATLATRAPGTEVDALSSAPGGEPHVFIWKAQDDLGGAQAERVVISIRPVDASGNAGATQTSQVFVVGNDAPTVTARVDAFTSGPVPISVGLFDSSGDLASLEVEFQAGAAPFQPCTIGGVTGAADPLVDLTTTSATSTIEPAAHVVVWDSEADLPDFAPAPVSIRVRAADRLGGRSGFALASTILDNRGVDTPPSAQVLTLPRGNETRQVVPVRVADAESETATLLLEARDDAAPGATFSAALLVEVRPRAGGPAIPLGASPRGTTPPLATSPGGTEYDLVWSWPDDFAGGARASASIRLTVLLEPVPPLEVTGQKIGNDAPALSGLTVEGSAGSVTVRYALRDSTADICEVFAVARAGRFEATLGAADIVGALTGIAASPTAEPRAFTWDTTLLFGGRDVAVELLLQARDDTGAVSSAVTLGAIALDNNRAPSVEVGTPDRSASALVAVSYLLRDPESDPVNVVVRRRLEGAPTASALPATAAGGTTVTALGSSPQGALNLFVWNVAEDLGVTRAARVIISIEPTDESGNAGALAASGVFAVGNDAPTLTATVAAETSGNVQIDVSLFDSSADLASLEIEYASGATPFAPCTISASGLADPLVDRQTTSSTNTALPFRHVLVWQSLADLPDALLEPVTLRLRATDVFGGASGLAEATTTLSNRGPQTPPSLIADPDGALEARQAGPLVDVPFRLVDAQSNPADVAIEYSTPALRGIFVAATLASGATPTTALASSETGVDHVFRWDAAADLDGASEVELRLTATDLAGGGRATATARTVALNDPPVALVAAAPAAGTFLLGFQPVTVMLSDSTRDLATVEFEVVIRSADGAILSTATASVPGAGTLVSTSEDGNAVEFLWNTLADLRGTAPADVRLRLRPRDALGLAGGTLEIGPYRNANGDRPIVALDAVTRTPGPLTLGFSLADAQTDTATVEVAYTLDGATFFTASNANIRSATGTATGTAALTNLSSVPVGGLPRRHALLWDAPADLLANRGLSGAQPLTVRLRARDAVGFGVSVTAAAISGNDAPIVGAVVPDSPALVIVPFGVTIGDSTADPVTITVEFAVGVGAFQPATIAAGALSRIPAAPGGTEHRLAWNAGQDLTAFGSAEQVISDVRLRVSADDFAGDGSAPVTSTSAVFEVFLSDDPIALITSPRSGSRVVPEAGAVTVTYLVFDLPGNPAMIDVRFTTPGAASRTATRGGGEGTTGLASSPSGIAHSFVWRVGDDIPFDVAGVTLTMLVREVVSDPGILATVRDLEVDGNAAPTVALDDIGGAVTPFIDLVATVRDAEADLVDLAFRVSFDGGVHFIDATVVPAPAGLPSSPGGERHRVSWLLGEDLVRAGLAAATQTSTVMDVTPSDGPGPLSRGPTFRTAIASFDAAVVLGTPDPDLSTMTVTPVRLAAGGTVNVTVTVIDVRGQPAKGNTVALSYGALAVVSPAGTTDANGVYRGTLQSTAVVTAALTAVIDPGPRQVVLTSVTVTFDPALPGSITDLRAAYLADDPGVGGQQNTDRIRLLWTATGADGSNGTAASYEIKVSNLPITSEALFNGGTASTVAQSPSAFVPLVAGSTEDRTVSQPWNVLGGTPTGFKHFAVRAVDVEGNKGPISNSLPVDIRSLATFPASTFDFGSVPVGKSIEHTFVISNTAVLADFTASTIGLSGSPAMTPVGGFTISNVFIPVNGTREIVVRFGPTDTSTFNATLTITHQHFNAPSNIASPQTIALTGLGVPATSNHPPTIPARTVTPSIAQPGAIVTIEVDVKDLENALPASDTITAVTADLRTIGGAQAVSFTAGAVVDALTRRYSLALIVTTTALAPGPYGIPVTATDVEGLTGTRTVVLLVRGAAGNLLEVAADGSKPFLTIGAAITATAASGDVILVYPGTYSGDGNRNLLVPSGNSVIIASAGGAASTIVDLDSSGNFITFNNSFPTQNTAVVGLTVKRCGAGAVNMIGTTATITATLADCVFEANTSASDGGAVRLEGAKVRARIVDCVFLQNTRPNGGKGAGLASFSAEAAVDGCLFDRQSFTGGAQIGIGAAMYVENAQTTVNRSTFLANTSGDSGGQAGGIGCFNNTAFANLTVTACVFDGSRARGSAGGSAIFAGNLSGGSPTDANVTVRDCEFLRGDPGAIFFHGTSADPTKGGLRVERSTISGNTSSGIQLQGASLIRISESIFIANGGVAAINIGGVGSVTFSALTDCSFLANTQGGLLFQGGGSATAPMRITRCTFRNNIKTGGGEGAGAYMLGNAFALVTDTVFEGNSGVRGGGVFVNGSATFDGCVFRDNSATGDGGGVLISLNGSRVFRIDRCLFEGNTASGRGGGIFVEQVATGSPSATCAVSTTSIADNAAGVLGGGGVHIVHGAVGFENVIIWNNTDTATGATKGAQVYMDGSGDESATIRFCDIQTGTGHIRDPGNRIITSGTSYVVGLDGNISADPLFTVGPRDLFYLSQTAAGEAADSPCVERGAGTAASAGVSALTTRSDRAVDTGQADMGYHRKP